MNENIGKEFSKSYEHCACNFTEFVSKEFEHWADFNPTFVTPSYLDQRTGIWKFANIEGQLVRFCAYTGYLIRCAEEMVSKFNKYDCSIFDENILNILKNNDNKENTIKGIAEYLNAHDKIKLGEPVRKYTIIDYDQLKYYFDLIFIDYCKQSEIDLNDTIVYEMIWQMASYGYVFKTAEKMYESMHGQDIKGSKLKSNAFSAKRELFARILISKTDAFIPGLLEIMMTKENIKTNQHLLTPLKIELLILELHYYYLSFCKNGKEREAREIIEEIKNAIISDFTNKESNEFAKLYDERKAFYGEMKNILPSEGESPKGTLFWEFGKLMCSTYHAKQLGAFIGFPLLLSDLVVSISETAFGNG